ncbi:MAG: sugar phosphate isomerase/epimerase [Clostridia bacterium]|nr:sugar phosphate isomerase/epimerase [Clostridia bacterium]
MKKGIRGHDVRAKNLDAVFKKCKACGISHLQLVLEKSVPEFKHGIFSAGYAEKIKNQLGDMKIAVLGSYIDPSATDSKILSDNISRFKEKIQYAKVLKPLVVGTETGFYKNGMTDTEEAYQYVLNTVRKLVKAAEKENVTVGIEGVHCFVINTPKKLARLIGDINSDNIKVIFDPVNYINIENYRSQDQMINDMFDLLSNKLAVLHAKDFVIENGKLINVMPTKGLLNYELVFRQMKQYNLDIPIICEELNENEANIAFENLEKIWRSL